MREFLRWWATRLAELLPDRVIRLGGLADNALVIEPVGPVAECSGGVTVSLRRGGRETPLGHFTLDPDGLADLPYDGTGPAVLRLANDDVLTKTVVLPLAAERDLAQVLVFEMDRETPFNHDEIYWTHSIEARDRHKGTLSVRIVLVPQVRLAGMLRALNQVGLFPRRVEVAGEDGRYCQLPLDDGSRERRQSMRWLVRALAVGCVLLAVAAVTLPFVRQQRALHKLADEIAARQAAVAETSSLNQELARLSESLDGVAKERAESGDPLAILAAATRVLSDDTYLTEVKLRQRQITMTGRSPAAARLIGILAADGGFLNPAFAAPVTRIEALHAEVFTISAEVLP